MFKFFAIVSLLLVTPIVFCETAKSTNLKLIDAADFASTLPPSETQKLTHIPAFQLDTVLVSNQKFLAFVLQNPEWQRDKVSKLFSDAGYLSHWPTSTSLALSQEQQPVIGISWFAANAYCEAHDGRLPRWYEWELVAAAGDSIADAREDPAWRQQMLNWYSQSSAATTLADVGSTSPNYYGIQDLHGVVWEWVEDFNSLLVSTDNREQSGADKLKFCGAGALSMEQKENYALLMRVALLSSLEARYTTRNLGFRCAYNI